MTEVPEHLLQRAAEARARLTGAAPPADAGGGTPAAETAPVPVAAAPTPAVPEEPKAPEPVAPYVEAALRRKTVPVWILPVLVFLPIWAIYYVGYLENPPVTGGFVAEGAEVYGVQCAGCHGGAGGGGTGRQLNGGEVVLTFPATDEGIAGMLHWVAAGTAGSDATYGDPSRPGGQRQSGSFGQMSGFGGGLSAEELAAVVYHERAAFGELDAETIDHELHLLEEVVHVVEDAGESFDGATLDEVRSWVAAASAKLAEDEVAAG